MSPISPTISNQASRASETWDTNKPPPSGSFNTMPVKPVPGEKRVATSALDSPVSQSPQGPKKPRTEMEDKETVKPSELVKTIGFGGFATVFEWGRKGRNLSIAIKIPNYIIDRSVIPYTVKSDANEITNERNEFLDLSNKIVLREAELLKQLKNNSNFVDLVGVFELYGWFCLGMDRHEMSLSYALLKVCLHNDKNKTNSNVSNFPVLKERLTMFLELLEAIQYLYTKDIIHNDLATKNLLASPKTTNMLDFERIFIADLGAAIFINDLGENDKRTIFTCKYLAPELSYPESVNPNQSSEVFALGFILLQLLEQKNMTVAWKPEENFVPLDEDSIASSDEDSIASSDEDSIASPNQGLTVPLKSPDSAFASTLPNTSSALDDKLSDPINESDYLPRSIREKDVDIIHEFEDIKSSLGEETVEWKVWGNIGLKMMQATPEERPSIESVIRELEKQLQEMSSTQ